MPQVWHQPVNSIPHYTILCPFPVTLLATESTSCNFLLSLMLEVKKYVLYLGNGHTSDHQLSSKPREWETSFWCSYVCISQVLSLKYNQQDATLSWSIYFYKLLCMFQAVPPPIIGSTRLYVRRQVSSNQYCCLLLSWMSSISSMIAAGSSIGLTIPDAVRTALCSRWWAEEPPETFRAIYRNK